MLKANGDAIHINGVNGSVLIANNALYANDGRAVYADGTTGQINMLGNAGKGSLVGVSAGFNAAGNMRSDFALANYSGSPSMDLVPSDGVLVATADSTRLANHDFNLGLRSPQADVGAYRANATGNPGWPLQPGFKALDRIFSDNFDP